MKKEYQFYIYIMSNYSRTSFYIGFCNNITRRIIEHKYGLSSEFTRKYKLKYLVYYEGYKYVNDAISREKEIKKWRREKKIDLIRTMTPKLKDLSKELLDEHGITNNEIKEIVQELKDKYGK